MCRTLLILLAIAALFPLTGCGGGGGGNKPNNIANILYGHLFEKVQGLKYVSGDTQGITDANGTFKYEEGSNVKFSVGDKVVLGEGKAKAAMSTMNISKSWIGAILITRLLMTLDDDNDPTKMNIPESVRTSASNLAITDVQALNDSGLHTLVTDLGQDPNTIVSQAAAESQLAGTIFSENDATASSITGGWISSDVVPVIIAFLDSTHYVSIQDLPAIGGGTPGMEMGTFTWNLTNGRFVAAPTVDTDGEYSFSDLTGDMTFSVKDSTATFLIGGADGLHTATRIAPDASNPLVGTWYISDWYGSDILMVFLANGEYYGTLNNIDSYFGHDGMEHGKYTYNSTTKQFMKTQIITDTDGSPSFAGEPEPDVAVTATVSGQNLTFGYQEGDQMVLQRVGQ